MKLVDFKPEHVQLIEAAGGREVFGPMPFQPGYADMCAEYLAWSVFDGDRIIGCGGVFREHEGCGTAWSLLLPVSGRHMRFIDRAARKILDACPLVRIQAHAVPKFLPALRWLVMLGFQCEGTLRKFTPSGADMLLFARVR